MRTRRTRRTRRSTPRWPIGSTTLIADRLDAALDDRLGGRSAASPAAYTPGNAGDINVNVTLDAPSADKDDASVTREATADADAQTRKTPTDPDAKREKTPVADVAKTSPLTTFTARTAVKSSPTERSVIAATSFGPTGRFARVVDVGPRCRRTKGSLIGRHSRVYAQYLAFLRSVLQPPVVFYSSPR